MRDYFEAEMRLLREAAHEFAESNPEIASQLNLKSHQSWNPHVERLLEGVAYLTAQIKQRLDDDIPEICETLLMQLWPNFLRHFPAATILQFQSRAGHMQKNYPLPENFAVQSTIIDEDKNKVICQFRTTRAITIHPIQVKRVLLDEINGKSVIKIIIQADHGVTLNELTLHDLDFYLHADSTVALTVYYAIIAATEKIKISFPNNIEDNQLLPKNFIKANLNNFDQPLVPPSAKSFYGLQLLQEYFSFREKFYFVTLYGLDKIKIPDSCQEMEISIYTELLFPKEYTLKNNIFLLNCVPAINLFQKNSEPIKQNIHLAEYPIIADINKQEAILIYSVDEVHGIDDNTGKRQEYVAMTSFFHQKSGKNFYHLTQRQVNKKQPSLFLRVNRQQKNIAETLSCAITASNGHYPRLFLQENSLIQAIKNLPEFIDIHSVLKPSVMLLPPTHEQFRWNLIAHLSLNIEAINEINKLRELLNLYDWTDRKDNRRRIEGLRELKIHQSRHIVHGTLQQCLEFHLAVQENFYLSMGDIYLFGEILHQFFSMYSPINVTTITHLFCQPSQKELVWNSSMS